MNKARWIGQYGMLLLIMVTTVGCSRMAYQRMEERSLLRYQQGVPAMSQFETVCRAGLFFEPGDFLLTYDRLWDVTVYPTYPQYLRKWDPKWCAPLEQKEKFIDPINHHPMTYTEACKYPKLSLEDCRELRQIIKVPNTDPKKGAVNAWPAGSISMDGLNWKSLMIYFDVVIVEGDKTPLAAAFRGNFNPGDTLAKLVDKVMINGQEWENWQRGPVVVRQDTDLEKIGELTSANDLYKAKFGNYTVMVLATYIYPITNIPGWIEKRRQFLREWVNTFKIEPLPKWYVKKTPEEIQRLRDERHDEIMRDAEEYRKIKPDWKVVKHGDDYFIEDKDVGGNIFYRPLIR